MDYGTTSLMGGFFDCALNLAGFLTLCVTAFVLSRDPGGHSRRAGDLQPRASRVMLRAGLAAW